MTPQTSTTTDQRPPRHRTLVIVAAVLLSAALAVAVLASQPVEVTVTEQPDERVDHLDIEIDAGSITVRPADELTLEITRQSSRFAGSPTIGTSITDGTMQVHGDCQQLGIGRCRTDVVVSLPPGTTIRARTGAGPVRADGVTGTIDLGTAAGGVRVDGIAGDVRLHTAAGSIDGEIVAGTIDASASAGSIALTVTDDLDHLRAGTVTGSIRLLVPDVDYAVVADTTMGRVRVEVDTASDARRTIDARTEVGDVLVRSSDTP